MIRALISSPVLHHDESESAVVALNWSLYRTINESCKESILSGSFYGLTFGIIGFMLDSGYEYRKYGYKFYEKSF